jgi:hypothetical protein
MCSTKKLKDEGLAHQMSYGCGAQSLILKMQMILSKKTPAVCITIWLFNIAIENDH